MEISSLELSEKYDIIKKIGKGTFGSIFKLVNKKDNTVFALKRLFINKDYHNRELDNCLEINNEFCLRIKYYLKIENSEYLNFLENFKISKEFYNEETSNFSSLNKNNLDILFIITDFYDCNLNQFIISELFKSQEDYYFSKIIVRSVLKGLIYLKSINFLHRDIKSDNIFIKVIGNNKIKCVIGDFGTSKKMPENKEDDTGLAYICSRPYRAPELLLGLKKYNYKIDSWSAGCLIYKILMGKNLFFEKDTKRMLRSITNVIGPPEKKDIEGMGDNRNIKVVFEYDIETLEQKLKNHKKE